MKKTISLLLVFVLVLSLWACGSSPAAEKPAPGGAEAAAPVESAEEQVDDPAWDALEKLGKVETENGLFYVSINLPADFVGPDMTQEGIDAGAGETYTSGKLNEDGSVTYKMTKKQHETMLKNTAQGIEESLQELVTSPDYAFTEITHNEDFTQFDAHLSTEELGITESFMTMGFYMYGGMYALFSGQEAQNITVNYYSASGELLQTLSSSDLPG